MANESCPGHRSEGQAFRWGSGHGSAGAGDRRAGLSPLWPDGGGNQNSGREWQMRAVLDTDRKAKRSDGAADTAALEREIDERVYRLYGLTAEEIRIVEENGK